MFCKAMRESVLDCVVALLESEALRPNSCLKPQLWYYPPQLRRWQPAGSVDVLIISTSSKL